MRITIPSSVEAPLAVGQRVRWKDPEAPRPEAERLIGTVVGLGFAYNGDAWACEYVGVAWYERAGWFDRIPPDEWEELEVIE